MTTLYENETKKLAVELLAYMRQKQASFESCFGALGLLQMHLAGSLGMSKNELSTMLRNIEEHYKEPTMDNEK